MRQLPESPGVLRPLGKWLTQAGLTWVLARSCLSLPASTPPPDPKPLWAEESSCHRAFKGETCH